MKKHIVVAALFLSAISAPAAEAGFLETLPAEEFSAAGLQKLTPEERARLEGLVQRKIGEVTGIRERAEAQAEIARQEADKRAIAAEAKARDAEVKVREADLKAHRLATSTPPDSAGKKPPGWFAALLTLKQAALKPEKEEPLESRLRGDFSGWNGHTIFQLEDGTKWIQQNTGEKYDFAPSRHSPKVTIKPAVIGGFWLSIEGVSMNVRVVPLDLSDPK